MQYDESFTIKPVVYAVAVVILDEHEHILLVQEAQPKAYELWHVPAGKPEVGETYEEAAKREAYEETGLEVELLGFLNAYVGKFENGEVIVRLAWLARPINDRTPSPVFKDEILECCYVSKIKFDELYKGGKVRMHHTKLMLEDALSHLSRSNSQE
jgi:8-oxo-dGTP diphosphatase